MINEITTAQSELIPVYREKWRQIALSTQPIDWQLTDRGFNLDSMEWASQQGGFLDYCISVLNCDYDQTRWQLFQTLVQECGWILADLKVCLVCDRPTDISFDGHCPVYAVGEVAVNFADGFSIEGICLGSPLLKDLQLTMPIASNWREFNVSELGDNSDRLLSHLCHELTPEQEALLTVYRQKWRNIMFEMGTVDRQQAIESIKIAYTAIDLPLPTIVFCTNPQAALTDYISKWNQEEYGEDLSRRFDRLFWSDLENTIESQIGFELQKELTDELNQYLTNSYFESGSWELSRWLGREFTTIDLDWYINPTWWAGAGAYIDFCITVLNCTYNPQKWEVFRSLVQHCGWIFPYTKVCYICDRPASFIVPTDDDDYLPEDFCGVLIEFIDGFSLSKTPEQLYASSPRLV
jgi:hypothetical protein